MVNVENVAAASRDYLYLKRRGYSTRSILEIVGNRFQLTTQERNVLYRGFFTRSEIEARKGKIVDERQIKGKVLKVDGYNQLITLESYRRGNFVFIATDGVVRDSASVHRSYKTGSFTREILEKLLKGVSSLTPTRIEFYFDRPVSFSRELCKIIQELMVLNRLEGAAEIVESPDYILAGASLAATSDSIVINKAINIFDLAGWFIHRVWKGDLVDLREFQLIKK